MPRRIRGSMMTGSSPSCGAGRKSPGRHAPEPFGPMNGPYRIGGTRHGPGDWTFIPTGIAGPAAPRSGCCPHQRRSGAGRPPRTAALPARPARSRSRPRRPRTARPGHGGQRAISVAVKRPDRVGRFRVVVDIDMPDHWGRTVRGGGGRGDCQGCGCGQAEYQRTGPAAVQEARCLPYCDAGRDGPPRAAA
jgi:hypothetical protein